ncbi:Hypothetical protein D9617_51g089000 [Elsinoe fawcettii]|nr:Hypothetical protein D9617_51g089000 [Elsinoe fawcettii]
MELSAWSNLVVLLVLGLILYDQLSRWVPTRLQERWAPKSRFGLIPVEVTEVAPDSSGVDIIFVHGLGSNPDTTWRAERRDADAASTTPKAEEERPFVNWVSDFLPHDLHPDVRRSTRLYFYNFESYWQRDAIDTRLKRLASNLLEKIKTTIQRSNGRQRDLVLVGYSYGGLVAKEAFIQSHMDKSRQNIAERIKGMIFMGTPHRGSSFTQLGKRFAQLLRPLGSNPSLLAEIDYDSPGLLDMNSAFAKFGGNDLAVVNFFEQRKTTIFRFWIFKYQKMCVPESSATLSAATNIGLSVHHTGLNKFGWKSDEYFTVLEKINEIVLRIMEAKRHRQQNTPPRPASTTTSNIFGENNKGFQIGINEGSITWNSH